MTKQIKTIMDFESPEGIDNIIDAWANNGKYENNLPNLKSFVDYHNIAYCFKISSTQQSALLTINILDNKVHLETWTVSNIKNSSKLKNEINKLVQMLGQEPL